jgi:hypothetical protein
VIERSRLQTAMGRAERLPQHSHLVEAIRQRLDSAHHSLERASALWNDVREKRRKDWKEYRTQLATARAHWREALRLLAQAPEGA